MSEEDLRRKHRRAYRRKFSAYVVSIGLMSVGLGLWEPAAGLFVAGFFPWLDIFVGELSRQRSNSNADR